MIRLIMVMLVGATLGVQSVRVHAQPVATPAAALVDPASISDTGQADQALEQVRKERGALERRRRLALAECATRILVNRCADEVERQYRASGEKLRAIERKAQEVIREARNLQRNEDRATREHERSLAQEQAPQRLEQAQARERSRQIEREERAARTREREAAAAENAARFLERQKAREERQREAGKSGARPGIVDLGQPEAVLPRPAGKSGD